MVGAKGISFSLETLLRNIACIRIHEGADVMDDAFLLLRGTYTKGLKGVSDGFPEKLLAYKYIAGMLVLLFSLVGMVLDQAICAGGKLSQFFQTGTVEVSLLVAFFE